MRNLSPTHVKEYINKLLYSYTRHIEKLLDILSLYNTAEMKKKSYDVAEIKNILT